MRSMYHALVLGTLALGVVQDLRADSLAAKRIIIDGYVAPLPDSLEQQPWHVIERFVDEYTHLLAPDEAALWKQRFGGKTEGEIGIDYEWAPLGWEITEIAPQSPAYLVDLRPGDIITSVNGRAPRWRDTSGSYASPHGSSGDWFLLEFLRGEVCNTVPVQLAGFRTEPVYVDVVGRTMIVVIMDFNPGLHSRFTQVTRHVREQDIDTIILDLRRNHGGLVYEAEMLLNEFVAAGDTILREQYRHFDRYTVSDGSGRWLRPRPLYVLQSRGTVSSGEIFTGAMLTRTHAVVIGTHTYGKGRIQRFLMGEHATEFADSLIAGLKYTIAIYHAGGVLGIDSIGVPPDVSVDVSMPPSQPMPASIDVVDLRLRFRYPTRRVADSINALAGGDVSYQIWCDRARVLHAYRAVDTLRKRLPTKDPRYPPTTLVDGLFAAADEHAVRAAIRETYAHVLDSFTMELGTTLQLGLLRRMPDVQRPADYTVDDDAMTPTSADLGMLLTLSNGAVEVRSVVPGTSAYEAGIRVGDRLVAINGASAAAAVHAARARIIELVRSARPVTLTLRRGTSMVKQRLTPAIRSTVVPRIYLDGSVGYLTCNRLGATDHDVRQLWHAITELRNRGMQRLVMDLRGVRHGSIEHVTTLAGYFADTAFLIALAWQNGGALNAYRTSGDGSFDGLPVTVVVDGETAGAAEVFAAAMRRRGNTIIIGARTAGMLHERRELALTTTLGVRYVWRRFTDVADSVVTPDIMAELPLHSPTYVVLTPALHRDIMTWRTHDVPVTAPAMVDLLQRVTDRIPNVPRHAIATSVFGEGARLYVLAEALREVVP